MTSHRRSFVRHFLLCRSRPETFYDQTFSTSQPTFPDCSSMTPRFPPSPLRCIRRLPSGGTPDRACSASFAVSEQLDRGRYAGPVGWMDAHGDGVNLELRCAVERSKRPPDQSSYSPDAVGLLRVQIQLPRSRSPRRSCSRCATRPEFRPTNQYAPSALLGKRDASGRIDRLFARQPPSSIALADRVANLEALPD